ncbi:hypothetical protein ACLOJK_020666 [Asimina triloba]
MSNNSANTELLKSNNSARLPRKRFYRARAHSNPLSDSHFPVPICPSQLDYSQHFPYFFPAEGIADGATIDRKIQFADIGCGFGGLLVSLSTLFPDTLMIGMELRDKVTEYVKERILALRAGNPGCQYENISVVRTNSMKYIPNYFEKGQLSKMFFLFPDPHFKEKNHRRRVISPHLLDEYAYTLQVGGTIYTITDVEELGDWMRSCLEDHPLFEAISEEELKADPVVKLLATATEEGQKVARNGGQTFQTVYRRIASVFLGNDYLVTGIFAKDSVPQTYQRRPGIKETPLHFKDAPIDDDDDDDDGNGEFEDMSKDEGSFSIHRIKHFPLFAFLDRKA